MFLTNLEKFISLFSQDFVQFFLFASSCFFHFFKFIFYLFGVVSCFLRKSFVTTKHQEQTLASQHSDQDVYKEPSVKVQMVIYAQIINQGVITANTGSFQLCHNYITDILENRLLSFQIVILPNIFTSVMHGRVAIVKFSCPFQEEKLDEHVQLYRKSKIGQLGAHMDVHACKNHYHSLEVHGANVSPLISSLRKTIIKPNSHNFTYG